MQLAQSFFDPKRTARRRYYCTSVLVNPGTDTVVPFDIVLPADCVTVDGIIILNNAIIASGYGDSTAPQLFGGPIAAALKAARQKIIADGHVPSTIVTATGGIGFPDINIAKYALGTVNIKWLSRPLFSSILLPKTFFLTFQNGYAGLAEQHLFSVPELVQQSDNFTELGGYPMRVKQLQGWLELTEIAVKNLPVGQADANGDVCLPFSVAVCLAYQK